MYGPLSEQVGGQWQIDLVHNVTVANTTINGDGIFFLNASNVTIANNTLNNGRGIDCTGNGNIITKNTVNSGRGISGNGNWNIISGNRVTNCNYTFVPDNPPPYDIAVGGSKNTVTGNYIIGTNGTAIRLGTSSNGKIVANMIADNKVGLHMLKIFSQGEAHDNVIYHNNFINNTENVQNEIIPEGFDVTGAVNIWDNGAAGNYWSNYDGHDYSGDGLGDTPYIIDEYNQDIRPLMEQVTVYIVPESPSGTPLIVMLMIVALVIIYRRKTVKN